MAARGPLTRAAVRLAAVAAGGTAVVLSVMAGRAAEAVLVLCAGSAALVWWLRRLPAPGRRPGAAIAPPAGPPATRRSLHPSERGAPPDTPRPALPPVATASVEELGREWQRTATVLETVVDPVIRGQVVRRRGEVLDELERRDPAGFARWLVSGASVDGSPARYLRGDSTAGPGPS
ncbi:hypothetical protein [Modestobacter sp. URMC 112]